MRRVQVFLSLLWVVWTIIFQQPLLAFSLSGECNSSPGSPRYISPILSHSEVKQADGMLSLVGKILKIGGNDYYDQHPIREFEELSVASKAFGSPMERYVVLRETIGTLIKMYRTIEPSTRQPAQPAGFLEESDYALVFYQFKQRVSFVTY